MRTLLAALLLLGLSAVRASGAQAAARYQPKRVNKAIELLESGQPVYYGYGRGGYDEGKAAAKTWSDLLMYDLEGSALDFTGLRAFMKGLADGGPTPSGHRTPAVIVTLPVYGLDADVVRANHWMIQQALASGVHGLHICHARNPAAVAAFIRAARYEVHAQAVGSGLDPGLRMFGAHEFASAIWGVSPKDYYDRADAWPLNPRGELMIGVKIEDREGLQHTEAIVRVPGVIFAEWGPRDTSYAHGFFDVAMDYGRKPGVVEPPALKAAADRVIAASKAAQVFILDNVRPENVTRQIDAGIMIMAGGIKEAADLGRAHTRRTMP
ncbi:MAG: aldolase/citrate lyase family protein [Opitutaceae bacterium]|nr:aldolase/citrate lyase family protein [Opitutaceae bacterium]